MEWATWSLCVAYVYVCVPCYLCFDPALFRDEPFKTSPATTCPSLQNEPSGACKPEFPFVSSAVRLNDSEFIPALETCQKFLISLSVGCSLPLCLSLSLSFFSFEVFLMPIEWAQLKGLQLRSRLLFCSSQPGRRYSLRTSHRRLISLQVTQKLHNAAGNVSHFLNKYLSVSLVGFRIKGLLRTN